MYWFLLKFFSLALELFRTMVFSLQMLGDFSIIFQLSVSSLIPLWMKNIYSAAAAAAAAKSLQLCLTLCNPIDGSPPGSPVPGILQARTLEWVAIAFSNAGKWKVSEVAQSCPTLSNPMDCSLPGSSIHGIFQARVLEWGAIAFSGTYTLWDHKCLAGVSQMSLTWNISYCTIKESGDSLSL